MSDEEATDLQARVEEVLIGIKPCGDPLCAKCLLAALLTENKALRVGKAEALQLAKDCLDAAKAQGLALVKQTLAEYADVPIGEHFEFRNTRAERAESELSQLRADMARLLWLAQSGALVAFSKDGDDCWLHWPHNPDDEEGDAVNQKGGPFDSIREAIDAQMKTEGIALPAPPEEEK